MQRHRKEGGVHKVSVRKAEAYVGNAENGARVKPVVHHGNRLQGLCHRCLLRAGREGQAVDLQVVSADSDGLRPGNNLLRNREALLRFRADAGLIKGKAHHRRAVFFHKRQDRGKALLLAVYAVHQRLSVVDAKGRLQDFGLVRVNLQRHVHHRLQLANHPYHHLGLVDAGESHVYVQNLGARLHLGDGLPENVIHITVL